MNDPRVEPVEGEVVEEATDLVITYPPGAGEVIDLADTAKVASVFRSVLDWHEQVYKPAMMVLRQAVLAAADREARYTLHYGGLTVEADSPSKVKREWENPELLRQKLIAMGMPVDRALEVVRRTVVDEVVWGEAKKAMANPTYKQIIEEHLVEVPATRYVRVKGMPR